MELCFLMQYIYMLVQADNDTQKHVGKTQHGLPDKLGHVFNFEHSSPRFSWKQNLNQDFLMTRPPGFLVKMEILKGRV